jgi:hypothetical protein
VPGTSAPPRAMTPLGAVVSKTVVTMVATVTASRAGVLKISTGERRPAATLSPAVKGKHAKVDARPPPTSVTPPVISVRQLVAARGDADQVMYCAIGRVVLLVIE